MKKALTVDLWDTLIYDEPEIDNARRDRRLADMAAILKQSVGFDNPARMLAAYETSWEIYESTWQSGVELIPAEQLKVFLDLIFDGQTPVNLPREELLQAYLEPILVHLPLSMPGAGEVLTKLKSKGWKLGLISNTGRTSGLYLRKVLQRHGIFDLIDAFFFSDEYGVRKPHREAFTKTLEQLDARAEASFHIGDNWEADVEGARKAGLTSLWFCRNGQQPLDPTVKKVKTWSALEFLLEI